MADKKRDVVCNLDHIPPALTKALLYVNLKKKHSPDYEIDPHPQDMPRTGAAEFRLDKAIVNPSSSPNKFTVLRVKITYPGGAFFYLDGPSPDHV